MINEIKERLINEIDNLIRLLDIFEFKNIKKLNNYLSFGIDNNHSAKSVIIYLNDNPGIFVNDYGRNLRCEIFTYIIKIRNTTFSEVIREAKNILGIDASYYKKSVSVRPFGGFYDKIKAKKEIVQRVLPESYLDKFEQKGNLRFLKDGIKLDIQKEFNIRFDIENNGIVIPIRNELGEIIGIKERINEDAEKVTNKYIYEAPCSMSSTLFGFSENYKYLNSTNTVYIVEAEKGCMQAASIGYRNFVSIGSGSISKKQIQLILSLNPTNIVLLHDVGYPKESVEKNIKAIKSFIKMKDLNIYYWNYFNKNHENKISCTDKGKEFLENVLEKELKLYEGTI